MIDRPLHDRSDPDPPGMYCRKCSADLADVDGRNCPHCGHRFNPEVPLSYAHWPFDPNAFDRSKRKQAIAWRLLLAVGLALAVICALFFAAAAYMMH